MDEKAVIQWIQENKFPPTIAEIRELAKKLSSKPTKKAR